MHHASMSASRLFAPAAAFASSGHFFRLLPVWVDQPVCLHAILITGSTRAKEAFLDPSMAVAFSFKAVLLRIFDTIAINILSRLDFGIDSRRRKVLFFRIFLSFTITIVLLGFRIDSRGHKVLFLVEFFCPL